MVNIGGFDNRATARFIADREGYQNYAACLPRRPSDPSNSISLACVYRTRCSGVTDSKQVTPTIEKKDGFYGGVVMKEE